MPTRARRACHCGQLQPCPVHTHRPWDHKGMTRQQRGLGAQHDANRKLVMQQETHCAVCGEPGLPNDEAGHIRPRSHGGTSERFNLQREHKRCNAARNRRRAG
jgi:hypothetical protein